MWGSCLMDPGEHDAAGDNVASSWIPTRKDHGHAQSMAPTTFMTIRRLGPGFFFFWADLGHDMALSICPTTYDWCVLCALLIWPDSSVWVIDMHGGWSLVRIWRDSDPKWLYDHCLEIGAYIHSFNDPTTPHFYHNNDVLRGPMTNDTQSDWTGELIMTIWFPRDDGILARGQMTGRKYDTNVAILLWQSYWERVRNQRSDFTWIELQTLRHVFVYAMCTGCDHLWQRA